MVKLGLIAGGGALPVRLAQHCRTVGRPVFVLRLAGFADEALKTFEGASAGLGELGRGVALLRAAGCASVCFAGKVERPNLVALRPDLRGLKALPGVIAAAAQGDDALLRALVGEFESEGFAVEGAHEVMRSLTLAAGPLGRWTPAPDHLPDIDRAMEAARAIGRLDVGQGAVACGGLVLALEAQEGTDAMLERVAGLPASLRGAQDARRGVLAKASKPAQEIRIDLPTIGPETVRRAAQAGLAGIAGEADRVLLVDRAEIVRLADEAGVFVFGAPSE
jgi:DUF1009 family protein